MLNARPTPTHVVTHPGLIQVSLNAPDALNSIQRALTTNGICLLRRLPATSDAKLIELVNHFGPIRSHPHADKNGITRIAPDQLSSNDKNGLGFSSNELFPHTDRSSDQCPPEFLLQACIFSASVGGDAVFVDGCELYNAIATRCPELCDVLESPASIIFGGSAEGFRGAIFEHAAGAVRIRFRYDRLGFFSAPVVDVLPTLLRLIREYTITVSMGSGDGYIVDNRRWLHGRTAFQGAREMRRILFDLSKPAA